MLARDQGGLRALTLIRERWENTAAQYEDTKLDLDGLDSVGVPVSGNRRISACGTRGHWLCKPKWEEGYLEQFQVVAVQE